MSLNISRTAVFIFVITFLTAGLSMAQDKSDTLKMDGHMKMDHSKMKQDKEMKEFDLKAIDKNNDGKVYQCPMDFDVLSDEPGKDPKCGMALEEVSIDKAAENLVSKGYKVKGMTESIVREGVINLEKIDANKDGKVYQDMMDYNVISDTPGKCPLCGMTLKEVTIEQAKSNLIKNGFKVSENNPSDVKNAETASVWNKYCPVSGMKINSNSPTVEYNGHTIGFCCPGHKHDETFLKDPEKYMKNLSPDGQEFIGEKS